MNILIITYQGDVSGATNSIMYLSKGLAQKGHHVVVGCRKGSLLYEGLQHSNVHVVAMKYKKKFDWQFIWHLRKIVLEHGIEIINAQSSWDRYSSILVRFFFRLKVKVVHTRRQTPMSMGGFFQNSLYHYGTDKIIAVSNGVKDDLVRLGLPAHHIKVIHNGTPKEKYDQIDYQCVNKLKQDFGIRGDSFVIGCVSRPKKQIQILKALKYINHNVVLIFIGIEKTPEFDEIIASMNTAHKIFFVENVSSKEVLNYYKLFDIHILASTSEGLSQSLLEAMALEVPVIATAAAGNLDLVQDGHNGLLFADEDIKALAGSINNLLEDNELKNTLVINGKSTAFDKFSIDNTINNYEVFFRELLDESS